MGAAKGALAHRQHKVALRQHLVRFVIHHLHTLSGQGSQRRAQPGKAVGNARVVLNIAVSVKVTGRLFRVLALHHIEKKVFHQLAVFPGFVQVFHFLRAVYLGSARGVGPSTVVFTGAEAR